MPRAAAPLPRRPVLVPHAPVLHRGGDVLQVGLDPRTAVVLRGSGLPALLARLDGRTALPALRTGAAEEGLSPADVDAVLQALAGAGLVTDAPAGGGSRPPPAHDAGATARGGPPVRTAVRLVGLGLLGQQLATLLLRTGVDVYAAELSPPGERSGIPPPLTDLVPGEHRDDGVLRLVNHWSKPADGVVSLTVVAAGTVEPDRVVTESLVRADQPHLLVRSAGTSVTVGPWVLPGRTPCLRCTDLTRRDLDPAWPVLLPQLTRLRLPLPEVLLAWGSSVAAAQVLAALHGRLPEVAGATLELDLTDHLTRWRAWPVHAACGCAWAPTTEWGP